VVSDVELDPAFERHRAIAAETGFRAVQSTPLFDRTGAPLGMLSTHFRSPRSFSERELLMTDLCAKRAADILDAALMRPAKRMFCEDCAMRSNGDRLGWIGVQLLRRTAAGPPLLLTYCPGCARQFVPAEIVWRA
jgi:hypothetical protein